MLTNNDGKSKVVLILAIFVLLLLAGGGYAGYQVWAAKAQSRTALFGMKLNADILDFSHRQAPDLYSLLISLDDTIALLDKEQAWLKQIEKQFPDQKQLINDENESLKKSQVELTAILTTVGKTVETLYVTYIIDQRRGMALVGKQKFELKKQLSDALRSATPLTARLKSKATGKWTDRALDLLK
jgi:hypothetical protein